ncbi:DUF2225 domain-containing protein [Clostridium sp.]|uniref:DUF2225 domain-containing protein n=1 Tax=Clostridium sp. TaxID=1506 RepID=UPI0026265C49|nr:DUF2225 domain-containing protein [Clostridium sp.]
MINNTHTKDNIDINDNVDELKNIFFKNLTCPVCENCFETATIKAKVPRIASKDSDFLIRYNIENPYFYEVCLCPSCGYAALRTDFKKIKTHQKILVKERISSKWVNRDYNLPFTENIAIERYKLALVNSIMAEANFGTKAIICLRIAWMYRLLEDEVNEINYITQALSAFNEAYLNESLPIYGLDKFSLMFLIGELNRRIGQDATASRWFSEVIVSIGADQKVKEMSRNGNDKIRGY